MLVLVFFSTALAQSENPPASERVILTDQQGEYPLGLHLQILEDPGGELTIEDVSSPAFAEKFTLSLVEVPNYGFTESAYWVRFSLDNQTRLTDYWMLDIGFPNTHYVDFYAPLSNGEGFSVKQSGVLRAPSTRDIFHPRIIFNLEIPTQTLKTFYLRFESGASMTIPLTLWERNTFINDSKPKDELLMLFYGVLIGLLVYNIFLLVSLRELSYLYLVLCLTSYLVWNASYDGYSEIYLFRNFYYLKSYYHSLAFPAFIISMILFSDTILELKTRFPVFHRIMIVLLSVWGILVLLIPFTSYLFYARLMAIWAVVSMIAPVIAGVVLWKRSYVAARYFMIAWIGLFGGFIIGLLVRLGAVPSSFVTENVYRFGTVWMAVCWSIALADRINLLKAETESANRSLRHSEHRLSQILDGMPLGVVLYTEDLKPKYANRRSIEILSDPDKGIRPDITAGRTLTQAIRYFSLKAAGSSEYYPLENFPVFGALHGFPASADDIEIDKGNERVPLEMWASPVKDDSGKVESAVVVFQEIAKRKQAELELVEYHKQLESLVEKRTAELVATNNEFRVRLEWLAAINLVNQIVARSADFAEIYQKIIEIINKLFACQDSFIAELDGHGRQLRILAHSCSSETHTSLKNSLTALPENFPPTSILEPGKATFFSKDELNAMDGPMELHFQEANLQGIALVPLHLRDKVLGFLGLELLEASRSITNEKSNLLVIFSTDIAQLIEDARLFEHTRELIAAEERNRLARDLHDSVTQALFSATLVADVLPQIWRRDTNLGLQELNKLKQLTHGALAEMRTMLLELRPSAVINTPLGELLSQLAEAFTSRSGLAFQLFIENVPPLPQNVQVNYYRIAQETLNNIVKHAQANNVSLSLSFITLPPDSTGAVMNEVEMEIRDDGVGFASEKQNSEHLGLGIMHERAAAIGADLTVESRLGYGTRLTLIWCGETGRTQ